MATAYWWKLKKQRQIEKLIEETEKKEKNLKGVYKQAM